MYNFLKGVVFFACVIGVIAGVPLLVVAVFVAPPNYIATFLSTHTTLVVCAIISLIPFFMLCYILVKVQTIETQLRQKL